MPDGPKIVANIRLKTTAEGGRSGPLIQSMHRCPLCVAGEYFDCGVILDGLTPISLGTTFTAPIVFLRPDIVIPLLSLGTTFTLWEGKTIADGTVTQIPQ
jgi:hypothetical protein